MSDWSDLLRRLETKLFAIADEYELEALAATAPDRLATRSLCSPGAAPASIAAREAALGAAAGAWGSCARKCRISFREVPAMKKIASLLVGLGLLFVTGAVSAAAVSVHLGFATYDPLSGLFSAEQYNPRLANGDPNPLWVRSGTTVAVYVHVDFLREGAANGQLSIEAQIVDHDDGFIVPGIDDYLAGPITGAPIPEVGFGGKAKESQTLGPFLFYVARVDVPGIRNVFSPS